jgi:hypothetical protein
MIAGAADELCQCLQQEQPGGASGGSHMCGLSAIANVSTSKNNMGGFLQLHKFRHLSC